jgi:hypothetical protein
MKNKILLSLMFLGLMMIGTGLFFWRAEAALNEYGRIPNRVATSHHANGGPARNNSHGYLYGK